MKIRDRFIIKVLALALVCMMTGCASVSPAVADSHNTEVRREVVAERNTDIAPLTEVSEEPTSVEQEVFTLENLPEYDGQPYIEINGNMPFFSNEDKQSTEEFENYSELDSLGRCGVAYANICKALMPTEERGPIGQVRPSGWHTVKYNDVIDGNYLYNRCHLIGYQLAGENANEKNLITGTRYLNTIGMLPFENEVADYVKGTECHVLYRVTPIFDENNLVASGVLMEAWSVEDQGEGICFNVYCYNVQPGIVIDYATGDSHEADSITETEIAVNEEPVSENTIADSEDVQSTDSVVQEYVLNKNTHKIHLPPCDSVNDMKEKNKKYFTGTIEELKEEGYSPCQRCLGQ